MKAWAAEMLIYCGLILIVAAIAVGWWIGDKKTKAKQDKTRGDPW